MKARLTRTREIGPATSHFDFEATDWDCRFVPGQFLSLTMQRGEDEITRAYSIATAPGGRQFGLCANLVPEGRLSPLLFGLNPGDEIDFKGPYGAFTLRPTGADAIFVATGTGIAPFRSMLLARLAEEPARRFLLIFGVRHQAGLLYREEFEEMARSYPNFTFRPTLTRPPETWPGLTGRVQTPTLAALAERPAADVYLCGLREMVDDVRARLKESGLDRKRIIYEKYD